MDVQRRQVRWEKRCIIAGGELDHLHDITDALLFNPRLSLGWLLLTR